MSTNEKEILKGGSMASIIESAEKSIMKSLEKMKFKPKPKKYKGVVQDTGALDRKSVV